jgi:hypothetical protein
VEAQEIERHPYALVNPVIDSDGKYVAMGPIGKIEPPQLQPVTAVSAPDRSRRPPGRNRRRLR